MSQTQVEKEKREEKKEEEKKEEKVMRFKKPVLPLLSKEIVFQKVVHFKRVKVFLPVHAPRLKLTELRLSKLAIKPLRRTVSKIIESPHFILSKLFKIRIPISKFSVVNSSKLAPIIISLIPSIQMKMPYTELFEIEPSQQVQEPKLKTKPAIYPKSEIFLSEPIKIRTEPVSFKVSRETVETREKVEMIPRKEERVEEMIPSEGEQEEHVLDDLFPAIEGGSCFKWKLHRPLCIVLVGERYDGAKMIEDLISTKYTFHGFYRFSKNLPWQKEVKKKRIIPLKEVLERKESIIYDSILSKDLIVSIPDIQEDKKAEIVKGLRDISDRGAKCLILHPKNVKPFEDLGTEVANVDIKFISLPRLDERAIESIGKIIGVDLEALGESVDRMWSSAVRLYEEEAEDLDMRLLDKEVSRYPERETSSHYLMKKVVYYYLKKKRPDKNIQVEEPIIFDDQGRIVKIVPDIHINGEQWEVETGYPSKDEENLIMEPYDPRARLVWKLKKYGEEYKKVNVVIPSVYAYLFQAEIRKVKEYFKDKIDLKFYTLHWYKKVRCKFFM